MSSLPSIVLADTDVISNYHKAGALTWLIASYSNKLAVAAQVVDEIEDWPGEGARAKSILEKAIESGSLSRFYVSRAEFGLYMQLRRRLGRGEAATIAIAVRRRHSVATDDGAARKLCRATNPAVQVYGTEDLLRQAVADGHLNQHEAQQIWGRMGISDLGRRPF